MYKSLGFIFLSLLLPLQSLAQTTYTLPECIELAIKNNPETKGAGIQNQLSNIDLRASRNALLPTLGMGVNHGYNFGRSIDRFTNQFVTRSILTDYFSFNANWTLFNGFNLQNSIRQQRLNFQASQKDIEAVNNRISMNVASAFLNVVLAREIQKSVKAQLGISEKQLERTQKLYQSGATDKSAVLALESQLANEQLSLVEAENNYTLARLNLQNLTLLPFSEDWDIIPPNLPEFTGVAEPYNSQEIMESAIKRMPEIQSAQLRVESSYAMEKASRGLRYPSISLYANMSTVYSENALQVTNMVPTGITEIGFVQGSNQLVMQPTFRFDTRVIPFNQQLRDNFGQTLGVSLSWNLFNGFFVQNNIKRSQLNTELQKNSLEQSELALRASVFKSVNDYFASVSKLKAVDKALEASTLQMDFAESRFEAGLMNYFDYVNTKNQLMRSQISQSQARFELIFNKMIVEFYNSGKISVSE